MRAVLFYLFICIQFFCCMEGSAEASLITVKHNTRLRSPWRKAAVIKKIPRFLLVTGCGRSGTGYMVTFLKASGLDLKHEYMGNDGSVSWLMAAEIEWAPWGPLSN